MQSLSAPAPAELGKVQVLRFNPQKLRLLMCSPTRPTRAAAGHQESDSSLTPIVSGTTGATPMGSVQAVKPSAPRVPTASTRTCHHSQRRRVKYKCCGMPEARHHGLALTRQTTEAQRGYEIAQGHTARQCCLT